MELKFQSGKQRKYVYGTDSHLGELVSVKVDMNQETTLLKSISPVPTSGSSLKVINYSRNYYHWTGTSKHNRNNGILKCQGQRAGPNHQGQGVCSYHNGQWSQSSSKNSLTHRDPWCWPTDHEVPRKETGGAAEKGGVEKISPANRTVSSVSGCSSCLEEEMLRDMSLYQFTDFSQWFG